LYLRTLFLPAIPPLPSPLEAKHHGKAQSFFGGEAASTAPQRISSSPPPSTLTSAGSIAWFTPRRSFHELCHRHCNLILQRRVPHIYRKSISLAVHPAEDATANSSQAPALPWAAYDPPTSLASKSARTRVHCGPLSAATPFSLFKLITRSTGHSCLRGEGRSARPPASRRHRGLKGQRISRGGKVTTERRISCAPEQTPGPLSV
jgi:hypothetical protein